MRLVSNIAVDSNQRCNGWERTLTSLASSSKGWTESVIRGRRKSSALLATAVLQAVPYVTHAQVTATWIGPTDRQVYLSWADPRNWSTNPHVPGAGDTVVFPASEWSTQFIFVDSPSNLAKLEFQNGLFQFSDGPLTFDGPAIIDVNSKTRGQAWLPLYYLSPTLPVIRTTSGLIKNGNGVLHGSGLRNVTGGVTVNDGTILAGGNYPLYPSIGSLTINGGAVQADYNGFGLAFYGPSSLPITIGSNGGTIVLQSDLDYAGVISGNSTLLLGKTGSAVLKLRSAASFSGWVQVQTDLDLLNHGAMANASGFIVTDQIRLDSAATANFNRISDSAPIYLRGGAIQGIGLTGSPGTEQLGPVTLESGLSTVNSDANLNLDFQSITRTENSVLSVGSSSFIVSITGATPDLTGTGAIGTPEVGIIPWARGTAGGATPLTVDSGVIRALSTSEFITTVPVSATSSNLKLTASAAVGTNATVNSLTVSPAVSSLTVSGGGSLTISSGALFLQGSAGNTTTRIDVPLHFGSTEAILHTSAGGSTGTVVLAGPISGSGGLTLAGTLQLSGASTYTGTTTLNGRLMLSNNVTAGIPGPLGLSASPVIINSSNGSVQKPVIHGITYDPPTGGTLRFDRDLIIHTDDLVAYNSLSVASLTGSAGSVEVAGSIQVDGALSLLGRADASPRAFVVSGRISGPGRLTNLSNVTLAGDNDFTGGVVLNGGTVVLGSNTALGSGTIWTAGGSSPYLSATKPITLSNPLLAWSTFYIGGDQPITFDGTIEGYYGSLLAYTYNTATTTIGTGLRVGTLRKGGPGLLQISSLPRKELTVESGPLRLLPKTGASRTPIVFTLAVGSTEGAQLDLTNHDLIVEYADGFGFPNGPIEAMVKDHRLTTSMSADGHRLGYAHNAALGLSVFSGEAVDLSCFLVKYTYAGDSNLDGLVDAVDLAALASHWQQGAQTWITGDFNYDARVDIADLYLLALNFQRGSGGADLAGALSSVGLDASLVPEPSSAAAVGALSLVILLQRRRRHPNPL